MRTNIIILSAVIALSACSRTPLGVIGQHGTEQDDHDTSATTSVATGSATSTKSAVSTADDTSTKTKTATTTATATPIATATPTDTVTKTVTNSGTATSVGAPFYIISAVAEAVDAFGNVAPDVRSFGVRMSGQAAWVSVSIMEKQTQALFYSETVTGSPLADSVYMSPGKWTKGLSPNTPYIWVVQASSFGGPDTGAHGPAAYTGEFTTGSFDPGTISISFTTAVHKTGYTDAVPGQKDVWMGTVSVRNGTPHTVGMNGMALVFRAWTPAVQATPYVEGSVGDYLTNCRLTGWPNTESFGSAFTPSYTTTLNMSKILKSQDSQVFDVTCDVTGKQPQRTTKVAIEVTDKIPQLSGFGQIGLGTTNGDPPQVYVLLVGKKDLASAEPLTLLVSQADDSPSSRILTANTADNTVTRLRIHGAKEKVLVQGLPVSVLGNDAVRGGNAIADISAMRVFDSAMSLACSGALDSSGELRCRNDNGLFMVDGSSVITLKVNIDQVFSPASKMAVSGDTLVAGVRLEPQIAQSDRIFKATGTMSGRSYNLVIDDPYNASSLVGITGNQMTVRKTQPTVATISLSDDEKKITNTTMMGQRQVLLRFSVTADSNADVSIKRIPVNSTLKNVGALFYELHYGGLVSYSDVNAGGIVFNLATETVIAAGTTKIFEVSASVYNASAGASIVTSLMGDDGSKSQNFLWSDNSADAHSLTSSDWWNGYQVKGLPTVGQTMK